MFWYENSFESRSTAAIDCEDMEYETRIRYCFYIFLRVFLFLWAVPYFFIFQRFLLWQFHCQCNGKQMSLNSFRRMRWCLIRIAEKVTRNQISHWKLDAHLRPSRASHPALKKPMKFSETDSSRKSGMFHIAWCLWIARQIKMRNKQKQKHLAPIGIHRACVRSVSPSPLRCHSNRI